MRLVPVWLGMRLHSGAGRDGEAANGQCMEGVRSEKVYSGSLVRTCVKFFNDLTPSADRLSSPCFLLARRELKVGFGLGFGQD